MSKPTPRVVGRNLRILARILRSRLLGPPIARILARQALDDALAGLDLAAEGDPAPFYMPPAYRSEEIGGQSVGRSVGRSVEGSGEEK